jgi:hypothetical protein
MYRFELYSGAILIGWSNLEAGDPPMGVAFGTFIASPAFEAMRSTATDDLGNRVFRDVTVQCADGEIPNEGEVAIYGIPYPLYETFFPERVEEYRRMLSAGV